MGEAVLQNVAIGYALEALAIGVIVTDREARLIYANAAAGQILGDGEGALRARAGRVVALRQDTQSDLQALIARVCLEDVPVQGGSNYLLAPSSMARTPDLAVCVLPFKNPGPDSSVANAMLLVRAIERDCNLEIEARRLFGLTKTEAKFASSLASGLSLLEAAKTHEVTPSTARSHMKNIFRKTGVSRQSQVAALLRGAQIIVHAR